MSEDQQSEPQNFDDDADCGQVEAEEAVSTISVSPAPTTTISGVGGPGRNQYTDEEIEALCQYAINKVKADQCFRPGRDDAWFEAHEQGLLPNRTPAGMRQFFCMKIVPSLADCIKNPEDLQLLRAALGRRRSGRGRKKANPNAGQQQRSNKSSGLVLKVARKRGFHVVRRAKRKFTTATGGCSSSSSIKRRGLARPVVYSDEEKIRMCRFLIDYLRSLPLGEPPAPSGPKLWSLAHNRGLFLNRTSNALRFAFRTHVLPHLSRYLPNFDDRQLLLSNLPSIGVMIEMNRKNSKSISQFLTGGDTVGNTTSTNVNNNNNDDNSSATISSTKKYIPYSQNELRAVCAYIVEKMNDGREPFFNPVSINTWLAARAEGLLPHRPPIGMKNAFRTVLAPNLQDYIPAEDVERFRRFCGLDRINDSNNPVPSGSGLKIKIEKSTNSRRALSKFVIRKRIQGRMARPYYSNDEKSNMCQFLIRKLHQWQMGYSDLVSGPKLWAMAHEEGLFLGRTPKALYFTFRHVVLPRLHDYVPNVEDRQMILANLSKMGVVVNIEDRRKLKAPHLESGSKQLPVLASFTGFRTKKPSIPFGNEEIGAMCSFVIEKFNSGLRRFYPGSTCTWLLAQKEGLLPGRPAGGLKKQFRLRVLPELRRLLSHEDFERLSAFCGGLDNFEATTNDDTSLEIGPSGGNFNVASKFQKTAGGFSSSAGFGSAAAVAGRYGASRASAYTYAEKVKMCRYVIRKLREWPSDPFAPKMPSGPKLWAMAHQEGLFLHRTPSALHFTFRSNVVPRLGEFVTNREDRDLLFANLTRIGVIVGLKRKLDEEAPLSMVFDPHSVNNQPLPVVPQQDLSPKYKNEFDDYQDDSLDQKPLISQISVINNPPTAAVPLSVPSTSSTTFAAELNIFDGLCNFQLEQQKRVLALEKEIRELKDLLSIERREKLANYNLIQNLSNQLEYHEQTTIKHQRATYELKSRLNQAENENVLLRLELSKNDTPNSSNQ